MPTRRDALRGLGVAGVAAVAGCLGDGQGRGGSNAAAPGETQEIGGLQATLVSSTIVETLSVVAEQSGGGNTTATTGTSGTPTNGTAAVTTQFAGEDNQYVVVFVRFENTSGEPQDLPHPGVNNPPAAAGEIYVSGPGPSITPTLLDGDLKWEGEVYDGLGEAVATRDWTLAPGESVTGYIIFRLNRNQPVDALFLNIDANRGGIARWSLS